MIAFLVWEALYVVLLAFGIMATYVLFHFIANIQKKKYVSFCFKVLVTLHPIGEPLGGDDVTLCRSKGGLLL